MKTLTTWNPFRELDEVDNGLGVWFGGFPTRLFENGKDLRLADWSPQVDIVEDDKEYVIKADLPEMKKDEVKVTMENGVLCISGERKTEKEEKNKRYHRIERSFGSFERSVYDARGCGCEQDRGRIQRRRVEGSSAKNCGSEIQTGRGESPVTHQWAGEPARRAGYAGLASRCADFLKLMEGAATKTKIFGKHDEATVKQIERCLDAGGECGVLCADGHKGTRSQSAASWLIETRFRSVASASISPVETWPSARTPRFADKWAIRESWTTLLTRFPSVSGQGEEPGGPRSVR